MKTCSFILKSLNIHKPFPIFVFKMYLCKGNVFPSRIQKKVILKREIGRTARKNLDFRN